MRGIYYGFIFITIAVLGSIYMTNLHLSIPHEDKVRCTMWFDEDTGKERCKYSQYQTNMQHFGPMILCYMIALIAIVVTVVLRVTEEQVL